MTAVAVPTGPDVGAPWHYGDPLGEQRTAVREVVKVDRSQRGVFTLTGPERLSWLNTVTSQLLLDLPDGASAEDLSLDANGRIEDHFVLTDRDGVTTIDTEAWRSEPLQTYLQRMIFWAQVTLTASDAQVTTLIGPGSGAALDLTELPPVYATGAYGDGFWRRMPNLEEDRSVPTFDVVTTTPIWHDLAAAPAGTWTYEALRVAAVRPRLGLDSDDRAIPHELRWIGPPTAEGAVHLDKGCYRGQETVSRVHNLGRSPRQLVLLHLDGSGDALPETGAELRTIGDKPRTVGRVGTVVQHHSAGPIALALLKRGIPADTPLVAPTADGEVAAAVDPDTVDTDETVPAGRAAQQRLRQGT